MIANNKKLLGHQRIHFARCYLVKKIKKTYPILTSIWLRKMVSHFMYSKKELKLLIDYGITVY